MVVLLVSAQLLSSCGGGSGSTPTSTSHTVTISWAANRETAVNNPGGGYTVTISGQPPINVPYISGVSAPTMITTTLLSGNYSGMVTAYSALRANEGTTKSISSPSVFTLSVP